PNAQIAYVPAGPSYTDGSPVPTAVLFTSAGKPGLDAQYFGLKGAGNAISAFFGPGGMRFENTPFRTGVARTLDEDVDPSRPLYRTVFTGYLIPSATGTYRLGVTGFDATVTLDGQQIVKTKGYSALPDLHTIHLVKGHRYALRMEAMKSDELVWQRVSDDPELALARASRNADVIVAAVGLTSDLESEESPLSIPGFSRGDRTTLDLPAGQRKLLAA